ncbi:MAG TPA: oligosaccharide flippase family protein [Candidatus Cybelea sp.]|nr:oligosaccharide flippase family protein [Candidatus Cybelea sp.]
MASPPEEGRGASSRLVGESLVYIASRALPSGITLVTGMWLTWFLHPEAYGLYGLGTALVNVASSAFFGWHALSFMRFYQSNTENPKFMPTIAQTFVLLCALTGLTAVAAGVSGWLDRDYQTLIWICVPGCWFFSWFELSARVQVARFRPVSYFWMNVARNVGILVFCITLAWLTRSPLAVLAGSFVAMLLSAVLFNAGGFDLRPRLFDGAAARQLLIFGGPLAVVQILTASSFATDRFLLDAFSGKASVGFYTVAYSLAQTTISTIGAGIDSAIYSRAVRAADAKDPAALQGQLTRNCILLLALLLPAAVGAALVAPALARLFVGPEYVGPVTALISWMAFAALILSFRANYVDHAFHFGNSTTRLTVVIATMVVVNVVADLALIPQFGAVGAAMASIVAGTIGLVHGLIASRSVLRLPFPPREIAKIVAATAAMALFLWPLYGTSSLWGLALQVIGGAVVFGVVVVATDLMAVRKLVVARLRRA